MANCGKRCGTFRDIAALMAKCARCKGEAVRTDRRAPEPVKAADAGRLPDFAPNVAALVNGTIAKWCALRQMEVAVLQHIAQGGNLPQCANTIHALMADIEPLTSAPPDEAERMTREIYRGIVRKFGSGWRDFRALALDALADRAAE